MHTLPLWPWLTYGPVRSRRLGRSLGLNILPPTYKLCSFNCVYCQYGKTTVCTINADNRLNDLPTLNDFDKDLEIALRENDEIDNITFSGNGEAALHPQFAEFVDIAKRLKEKYFPEANLSILSNSSAVSVEKVRRALSKLDFRIMKLDAGDPETLKRINRPCKEVDYQSIVNGLKSLEGVTLQTMFVDGPMQNIGERAVKMWVERVGEIQPLKAQIYSLDRPPAESSLQQVPAEKLREIAAKTKEATGVDMEVFTRK